MKKVAILALIFGGFVFNGYSQENNKKPERIKLYPSTHTSETKLTPEQEIQECEQHLEALDAKEAWIKENPEELKIANENGWFANADQTRVQLKARIKELKK